VSARLNCPSFGMKNWIIIIIAVVGTGFGGYSVWNWQKTRQAPEAPARPTTAKIELRNINFIVTAAIDIGDTATNGQLLCALDDRDLQTELSTQTTQIEGAQLQLEKARRNFERSKRLYENKLIAQEIYDDTVTEYELAKNALDRAWKALGQVKDKLLKTRIVAPFDCTVLTRPVSIGQAVSGSGGVSGGSEIMTIANLKEMIITAHMNQTDVPRLKLGQQVDVEV